MDDMMKKSTVDEMQENFVKYLDIAEKYGEVVVFHEGKAIARLIAEPNADRYLTDTLCGMLKQPYTAENARKARMKAYEDN